MSSSIQQINLNFLNKTFKLTIRDQADQSVMREVFKIREYRAAEEIIMGAESPIIDAGAHVGFFVLYARALNPKVKIFALEPEPNNAAALREHLKDNKIKGVKIVEAALAERVGESNLVISTDTHNHRLATVILATPPSQRDVHNPPSQGGSRGVLAVIPAQAGILSGIVKVKTVNFANFCETNKIKKISLLKMDIEGGEYGVIENLGVEDFAKIGVIIMEYHNSKNENYKKIENRLRKNGFSVQIYPSKFDKKMGFLLARNKRKH